MITGRLDIVINRPGEIVSGSVLIPVDETNVSFDDLVVDVNAALLLAGFGDIEVSLEGDRLVFTSQYDFTIEDPLSWDVSWSAKFPMRRIEDPLYEYACHEGNHGLQGILAGWRRYESMGMNGDGTPMDSTP